MNPSTPKVQTNFLDRLISAVAPNMGLRRLHARHVLNQYEAAKPSRLRKGARDNRSPDAQVQHGAVALRGLARNMEQNHDIARGALRTMVNNVIGPGGIGIEPQPRRRDGTIHEEYALALREGWRDWCINPEVTHVHHWAKVQRLVCNTWFRDGECFSQRLKGAVPALDHGTRVPYSLELIEPDLIPMDYFDETKGVQQGIERNTWGRATGYWCYKAFPDGLSWSKRNYDVKRVPAANMHHIASVDRIGQVRGVSIFASVITRLEDIKDYEESERIAAKVAASLTAYVKRGSPEMYGETSLPDSVDGATPQIGMAPGMIIQGLKPGEEIGMIDSNRPNPNLITFRSGQLRAAVAGIGASYSSVARDYNGTYSAQRQELVEQWINYAVLTDDFVGQYVQPVWQDFVQIAHISGVIKAPKDVDPDTMDDALFVGQSMPWIDPLKEALAWTALVQAGFASEVEVMRKRGANPRDVLEQINAHRQTTGKMGLYFSSDFANVMKQPQAAINPDQDQKDQ
ncbi:MULTISPECIES: phage portal protein [unclassified Duganella]|uniref:phage portal protein n=1 Tax=unclassified Duganella TaxID=2636909 RepID=UPI00088DA6FD|nr:MULTISPECIES: phage portal protein [unclassified Duganella]SDH41175.1 phage portal protein, lambda family [Duganella sp. OV458]SDK61056.1 phage portal protein, lambda family [Duganella sp. OV510]